MKTAAFALPWDFKQAIQNEAIKENDIVEIGSAIKNQPVEGTYKVIQERVMHAFFFTHME